MFCEYCNAEMEDTARFCPMCGKPQISKVVNQLENQIENYDALMRRANKMVNEFSQYPLMPEGDWSIEFIRNVFNFNPLFVLDNLKKSVMDMLLEESHYQYDEYLLMPILEQTYGKAEVRHKVRILQTLVNNYKQDLKHFWFKHSSYRYLRQEETVIFYYAFSIFYIARDLRNCSAMLVAREALKAITLIHCEKNPEIDGIRQRGKLLKLTEFAEDRRIYEILMKMIEAEIENLGGCVQQ